MSEKNQDLIIGKNHNEAQESKQEKLKKLVSKFQRQSNSIYCGVINFDGIIYASELAEHISDSVDKNAVIFLNALQFISENRTKLINFTDQIGKISMYFDYDLKSLPAGFTLLVKTVIPGICFITVLPAWLDLTFLEISFDLIIEKIANLLKS